MNTANPHGLAVLVSLFAISCTNSGRITGTVKEIEDWMALKR